MSDRWDGPDLLQPITADQPCGEDLENTQLLSSFDAFRVFGRPTPFEDPPAWKDIRRQAIEALARSKDLRLLAHLGAALLWTDGLLPFVETLKVASGWLESYWSDTYPLVHDGNAIARQNALNCFADQIAVVDGLRRTPLVDSLQFGKISLRDIEKGLAPVPKGADPPSGPSEAHIKMAFGAMPLEDLRLLEDGVAGAVAALQRIEARMSEEAGSEATPNLKLLSSQLLKIHRLLRDQSAPRTDASAAADRVAAVNAPEPIANVATKAVAPVAGTIGSREEAIRALDIVADFFRRTEPSSPVPLFLERARRLVSKDFLEVLADVAPDGLTQARVAGGLKKPE